MLLDTIDQDKHSALLRMKAFLFCLAILVWRCWDRLSHPGIWAEDGRVFLGDALATGWSALFVPYEGYFHLFNRFCIQLFTLLPLAYLPFLITLVCVFLFALVMSTFAHARYRYLVPSDLNRFLIAGAMCCTPGGPEVIGNLCNSHRILAIFFMFIALKPADEKMNWVDLLLSFIIVASAGEVLLFVPVLAYRIYKRYSFVRNPRSILIELGMMAIVLIGSVINFSVRGTNSVPLAPDFFKIGYESIRTVLFYFTLEPVLGWRLTGNLYHYVQPLFWVVAVFSFGFLIRQIVLSRKTLQLNGYLALLCLFGVQFLSWLVRGVWSEPGLLPGMWLVDDRSSFTVGFTGFFLWALSTGQHSKKIGISFVVLYFVMTNGLAIKRYGDFSDWPQKARLLESAVETGCPAEVDIPVFPVGWGSILYRSNKTNANCGVEN